MTAWILVVAFSTNALISYENTKVMQGIKTSSLENKKRVGVSERVYEKATVSNTLKNVETYQAAVPDKKKQSQINVRDEDNENEEEDDD